MGRSGGPARPGPNFSGRLLQLDPRPRVDGVLEDHA